MKTVRVKITSLSPYNQSGYHSTEKLPKELNDAYEKRTWREKGHWNKDGFMIIKPMVFANCIKEAAKYSSISIPGKGKSTFTKHFEAGVLMVDEVVLPITRETVHKSEVFCNADGKRGSGTRVMRFFPMALEGQWDCEITMYILDDIITKDVFERVLQTAGNLIGIGQFRPRNLGHFGRFKGEVISWVESEK